jgi:multiple sugar transport system permease protein
VNTTTVHTTSPAAAAGRAPATAPVWRKKKTPASARARAVAIAVVALVTLFPYIWMVLAAFKTNVQISDSSQALVFTPTMDNFRNVLETNNFVPYILNSIYIAVGSTLVSLLLGVPAAWAIARFRLGAFNGVVLLARVVPAILLLVPWYYVFSRMGLVGGYSVLILSHMFVGLPLVTWIMTGFFKSLPAELDEAGQIDGLTEFGCFLRISLPLAVPGMATAAILSIVFSWNNFLFSLILANERTMTLPVALFQFMAYASVDWGGLMAAATVMTAPIIIFSLFAQKYVVGGLTAGATKG